MKLCILLIVLLGLSGWATATGLVVPAGYCPGTRDLLLTCFDNCLVGYAANGNSTLDDFNQTLINFAAYLPDNSTFTDTYTAQALFDLCDVVDDDVLDLDDWNSTSSCLRSLASRDYVCRLCYQANCFGVVKKSEIVKPPETEQKKKKKKKMTKEDQPKVAESKIKSEKIVSPPRAPPKK